MKLLDRMKKYDRCLVRESAKLTKIYNMLIKEADENSDSLDDLDEEKCPECGKDPCICDETEENCDECGIIPEEDFIKDDEMKENDMLRNRPHNGHIDDPAGVIPESEFFAEAEKEKISKDTEKNIDESDKTDKSDDEEVISAEEFFAEAEKECKDDDCNEDDEQMMSAEEFFSSQNAEVPDESKSNSTAKDESEQKKDESEQKIDEAELNFIPAEEWIQQANEQSLEESLKSYRRKNHRLFNG